VGAGIEGRAGDGRLVGVDGDSMPLADEALDHRRDERRLRNHVEDGAVGAGGLRADVDDVRTCFPELARATEGSTGVAADAVAREGIVGEVEDAHDLRAVEEEVSVTDLPGGDGLQVAADVGGEGGAASFPKFGGKACQVIASEKHAGHPAFRAEAVPQGGGGKGEVLELKGGGDDRGGPWVAGELGGGGWDHAKRGVLQRVELRRASSMRRACQRCSRSCW
jgi:hypothetical protein